MSATAATSGTFNLTQAARKNWSQSNLSKKFETACVFVTKNGDIPLKYVQNFGKYVLAKDPELTKAANSWNKFLGIFGTLSKLSPEKIKNSFTHENKVKKAKAITLLAAEVISLAGLALFVASFVATTNRFSGSNFASSMHALSSVNALGRFGVWSGFKGVPNYLSFIGGTIKSGVFFHELYAKRAKKNDQVAEAKTHSFFEAMAQTTSTALLLLGNPLLRATNNGVAFFANCVPTTFKFLGKWNKECEAL